jgi:hypothetical protein
LVSGGGSSGSDKEDKPKPSKEASPTFGPRYASCAKRSPGATRTCRTSETTAWRSGLSTRPTSRLTTPTRRR